jgi:hypothetical protein
LSIYATLWTLHFPRTGEDFLGCDWIQVRAQGVPGHIGTPTKGFGYEDGDPCADFLPPPIALESEDDTRLRAVFIIASETKKGTPRSGQEYVDPLLVLTGEEYERIPFAELHDRICAALRGDRPRVVLQHLLPDGTSRVHFEDGSIEVVEPEPVM